MSELLYFCNVKRIITTDHFCVFVPETPHIDRMDGGHICISATRNGAYYLQDLNDQELFEMAVLQKIVGQSMLEVLQNHGVNIKLINYQINGNWTYDNQNKPLLHIHMYGRSFPGRIQRFGQSLYFPLKKDNEAFYMDNKQISDLEIEEIRQKVISFISDGYPSIAIK